MKKETTIQKGIINWLLYHQCFIWRNNSGSYETAAGHYVSYGFKGSPDIIGIMPDGRFIGCEIKTEKGRQKKEQKQFEERCKKNNGLYFIIRSIDDCEKLIKPLLNDQTPHIRSKINQKEIEQ